MKYLLVLLAVLTCSSAQKSVDAPHPALIEVPMHQVIPVASPALVSEGVTSVFPVEPPTIEVPQRFDQVVDIPFSPIPLPAGEVQEAVADYHIPQPVVEAPGPVFQEKPVVFNVPQNIIQVPRPVIRYRPILHAVPHVVKMHRPNVFFDHVFFSAPPANVVKSGFHGPVTPVIPVIPVTPVFEVHAHGQDLPAHGFAAKNH